MPPTPHHGSEAMKARVLPQVLSGEKVSPPAITEPSGGSDVANLRTTARRDADHYVLNGSKTFITSGMRADFITLVARVCLEEAIAYAAPRWRADLRRRRLRARVKVGRICSAVKVNAIGAGTEEIMKDLVAVRWGSE